MKNIVKQTEFYTICELTLKVHVGLVDTKYIISYKDTPREDICSTYKEALDIAEKHVQKGV